MEKRLRNRPEIYSADGIPIYYNIYNEKDGKKLHMSIRFPKERVKEGSPSYGKIVYEEVHLLPVEAVKNPSAPQDTLAEYAPKFWRHFFLREENAAKKELFFEKAVKNLCTSLGCTVPLHPMILFRFLTRESIHCSCPLNYSVRGDVSPSWFRLTNTMIPSP